MKDNHNEYVPKEGRKLAVLFYARMSESSGSAFGGAEFGHLDEFGLLVAGDDHLRDAFARLDGYVFCGEVNKDYANLAAVVGIDGTGCVEHGDAALERHAASRTNLRLITCRQLDEEPCWEELALKALEGDGLGDAGADVHTRSLFALIPRKRIGGGIDDFYFHVACLGFCLKPVGLITLFYEHVQPIFDNADGYFSGQLHGVAIDVERCAFRTGEGHFLRLERVDIIAVGHRLRKESES